MFITVKHLQQLRIGLPFSPSPTLSLEPKDVAVNGKYNQRQEDPMAHTCQAERSDKVGGHPAVSLSYAPSSPAHIILGVVGQYTLISLLVARTARDKMRAHTASSDSD